jgi:hypothetical protein
MRDRSSTAMTGIAFSCVFTSGCRPETTGSDYAESSKQRTGNAATYITQDCQSAHACPRFMRAHCDRTDEKDEAAAAADTAVVMTMSCRCLDVAMLGTDADVADRKRCGRHYCMLHSASKDTRSADDEDKSRPILVGCNDDDSVPEASTSPPPVPRISTSLSFSRDIAVVVIAFSHVSARIRDRRVAAASLRSIRRRLAEPRS